MFERSDLKTRAKLALKRNYWGCVIAPVLLATGTWLTSVILNLFTGPSLTDLHTNRWQVSGQKDIT